MGELRRLEARLTEEQMDMLDGLARDTGLTKTDVIRTLITHASVADKLEITGETVIVLDCVSASKVAYQLRKVGINLNQATAALNTIARAAQKASDDPLQVLDLVEAIESVKYLLIGYEGTRRSARNLMEGLTGSRGVFLDRLDSVAGSANHAAPELLSDLD
jgi:hypothetical protein